MPRRPHRDKHALDAEPFGYLLTLDLYGCRSGVCDDIARCYEFLTALVSELRMTMQSPPFLFRSPDAFPDKAGLSGWVPLIESGIQIHTLTPRNFVTVDIYCCRQFDASRVTAVAQTYFAPKEVEMNQMPRGLKYNDVV